MKYYTGVDVLRSLSAQAAHPDDVPGVQRQMTQLLRSRNPVEAAYDVQTLAAILSAAKNISLALTIVLLVVAFIALLISASHHEQHVGHRHRAHREIGIRKAIGCTREILYQS